VLLLCSACAPTNPTALDRGDGERLAGAVTVLFTGRNLRREAKRAFVRIATVDRESFTGRVGRVRTAALASGVFGVWYGVQAHLSVRDLEHADLAAPWHPLFVIAPIVVGTLLVLAALFLVSE
jgi:hypothetical protein